MLPLAPVYRTSPRPIEQTALIPAQSPSATYRFQCCLRNFCSVLARLYRPVPGSLRIRIPIAPIRHTLFRCIASPPHSPPPTSSQSSSCTSTITITNILPKGKKSNQIICCSCTTPHTRLTVVFAQTSRSSQCALSFVHPCPFFGSGSPAFQSRFRSCLSFIPPVSPPLDYLGFGHHTGALVSVASAFAPRLYRTHVMITIEVVVGRKEVAMKSMKLRS